MTVIYNVYAGQHNMVSDFFNRVAADKRLGVACLLSTSCLFHTILGDAHNNIADAEAGCLKGLLIAAIEVGFIANILLATVETIARLALGIIFFVIALLAAPFDCCKDDSISQLSGKIGGAISVVSPLYIAQSAVSCYSNIAYMNDSIDYQWQANHFLFCKS